MKEFIGFFMIFSSLSCATYAQEGLSYIKTDSLNSPSMNIVSVDEFLQIINENRIRTVFFTDRQFIIQGNSLVYTIDKKGYNNLLDYKNGHGGFSDGESYYLGREVGLKNQQEVDYYRKEAFVTINDYRDAVSLGFSPTNSEIRGNLYGLISRENLQKNIRFANIAVYLEYYYNWPRQSDGRRILSTNGNTELIGNTDVDYLADRSNGTIRKMSNYEYFIINLPIVAGKDSFLYYAVRMAQYSSYSEYMENRGLYSIKDTGAVLRHLGFNNIDDMVRADGNGIKNSADYYLTVNYRIGKNDLENNRPLIREIETIKQRFNLTSIQQAMVLNYILKQPKGMPYSINAMTNGYNQEYRNNPVIYAQGWPNKTVFDQIFSVAAQIDRLVIYNSSGEALYIK